MGFIEGLSAPIARVALIACCCGPLLGCSESILQKSAEPEFPPLTKPLSEEQRSAVIDEMGRNWLYGQGLGDTALAVGASIIFPPYLIALVGNGALSLAGYEPISVAAAMPEPVREKYVEGRDTVLGAPGQAAAAIAGEEFRTQSMAKDAIKSAMLSPDEEVRVR